MKKRIIALVLLLCLLPGVFSLSSCKKKKPKNDPVDQGTAATTDRWEILGPEIAAALDANARTFKIECADFNTTAKISRNKKYLKGPDSLTGADSIDLMIYERNNRACQLLGTTIEYEFWDDDKGAWGVSSNEINTLVQANNPDAPDLFVNQIYDLNKAMLTFGVFKDVKSLPGSYFDFSAEGWMADWMESMSFTGDRAYVLAGDYFLDVLRSMGVLPFNTKLMDENGDKLAAALFGAGNGLTAGETMSNRFFDYVEDGNWTWDSLKKLSEAIYVDSDGDGQKSIGDLLGIVADCYGGVCTALYLYSSAEDAALIERKPNDAQGGKMWAYLPAESTAFGEIFDAVASVFNGDGALATYKEVEDTTEGLAGHRLKFARDQLLFAGYALIGDLEDDAFKQMTSTSLWSVVPLPKVSADKKYNTFVYDTADAGAINVRTSPEKARAISAYLQYCTEHSANIREEFLTIVTKFKTTEYNQGTSRMLDLIYESVYYGGAKVIDGAIWAETNRAQQRWYDYMKDARCVLTAGDFVDKYQSARDAKQAKLDEIMLKWYNLPTAETEAAAESAAE